VKSDFSTEGNWLGVYGADGYSVAAGASNYPAYATVTPIGNLAWTWSSSTQDTRAMQKVSASDRIASCWYTQNSTPGSSFSVDVNLTDGQTHSIAVYALDWDGNGPRMETINIVDASSGTILDSRSLSSFEGGEYLVWNVSGHIRIQVTNFQNSSTGVISGLFFGPAQSAASPVGSATYLNTDATTRGNWQGVYGADGYNVIAGAVNYPAYATVVPRGNISYTWMPLTLDPRALQVPAAPGRIAACWPTQGLTAGTSFAADVNLTDQKTHKVTVYMLDWDNYGPRSQQVQILDSVTGAVLDSRKVSAFSAGQYLSWNISGHVLLQVTNNMAGSNAVINGLFFSPAQ
jgi:hypothetical protein